MGKKKSKNNSLIISVVALIFSFVAIMISGFQAYDAHHSSRVEAKASLVFYDQLDDRDKKVGFAFESKGPGVAIIKSMKTFVDRKPVSDLEEAIKLCNLKRKNIQLHELYTNYPMQVGETLFLMSRLTDNKDDLDNFIDCIDKRFAVLVTYCSVYNRCEVECSTKNMC